MSNPKLTEEQRAGICAMYAAGETMVEIMRAYSITRPTVAHVVRKAGTIKGWRGVQGIRAKRPAEPGELACANCAGAIEGYRRPALRKCSGQKRQFCCRACFTDFRRAEKAKDRCVRCGKHRARFWKQVMRRGLCPTCYEINWVNRFNPELIELNLLAMELKREIQKREN